MAVRVVACALRNGLSGCGEVWTDAGAAADVIFVGDNMVTMDPDQQTVEARVILVRSE